MGGPNGRGRVGDPAVTSLHRTTFSPSPFHLSVADESPAERWRRNTLAGADNYRKGMEAFVGHPTPEAADRFRKSIDGEARD